MVLMTFLRQSMDWRLRTLAWARNYSDVVRRNPGQFGFEEIGGRSTFRAPDRPEIRSGTRSDGADFALPHSAKFWTYDAAVRAALSFERMHQQRSEEHTSELQSR